MVAAAAACTQTLVVVDFFEVVVGATQIDVDEVGATQTEVDVVGATQTEVEDDSTQAEDDVVAGKKNEKRGVRIFSKRKRTGRVYYSQRGQYMWSFQRRRASLRRAAGSEKKMRI